MQLALRVRDRARGALFNATLLASQAEDLAGNVTVAEDRGAELEGVAMETAELITMATEVAQSASSDARSLQEETEQLLVCKILTDFGRFMLFCVCRGFWGSYRWT